jgi:hypothetical protein
MARGRKLLTSEIERIRLDYTDPERTVQETADAASVATSTVRALAKKHGWARRRIFGRGDVDAGQPDGGQSALDAQLASLERVASRSIFGLERSLARGEASDPERSARALATNVRTYAEIQKLKAARPKEPETHDGPPPRTLAELRDELRRHLERVQEEEWSRELRGDAEPT